MASNINSASKKRCRSSESDEDEIAKRKRPLATATQLVQSINAEWSSGRRNKRVRSKSCEAPKRNVKAKMSVDLSSSIPEPTPFLMGAIVNELENISKIFSSSDSSSSGGGGANHPLSPLNTRSSRSLSSPSQSPLSSPSPSPQSSPDYYDKLVTRGFEMLERMREDPDVLKYFKI